MASAAATPYSSPAQKASLFWRVAEARFVAIRLGLRSIPPCQETWLLAIIPGGYIESIRSSDSVTLLRISLVTTVVPVVGVGKLYFMDVAPGE